MPNLSNHVSKKRKYEDSPHPAMMTPAMGFAIKQEPACKSCDFIRFIDDLNELYEKLPNIKQEVSFTKNKLIAYLD